jgi:hypothetical protein
MVSMPVGFMERGQEEYIIDGYTIFKQDRRVPEDMDIAMPGRFTFSQALHICEEHNGREMIE